MVKLLKFQIILLMLLLISCMGVEPGEDAFVSIDSARVFKDENLTQEDSKLFFLYKLHIDNVKKNSNQEKVCLIKYKDPFSGEKTAWISYDAVKPFSSASRVYLKYHKKVSYSDAVEICKNSICGKDCNESNNDCPSNLIQLLEYGWTPDAEAWIKFDSLQMIISEGRGPRKN